MLPCFLIACLCALIAISLLLWNKQACTQLLSIQESFANDIDMRYGHIDGICPLNTSKIDSAELKTMLSNNRLKLFIPRDDYVGNFTGQNRTYCYLDNDEFGLTDAYFRQGNLCEKSGVFSDKSIIRTMATDLPSRSDTLPTRKCVLEIDNDYITDTPSLDDISITFYTGENYTGSTLHVSRAGNFDTKWIETVSRWKLGKDGSMNNNIRSVKISSNTDVVLYQMPSFKGASYVVSQNLPTLPKVFADAEGGGVSSFIVRKKVDGVVLATLWAEENYKGEKIEVIRLGLFDISTIGNVSAVKSVKVKEGYNLTIFELPNGKGNKIQLKADTPVLSTVFSKSTLSAQLDAIQSQSATPTVVGYATLYDQTGYKGNVMEITQLGTTDIDKLTFMNDNLRSIKVKPGYKVTLSELPERQGDKRIIVGNRPSLGTFNGKTSSLVVEQIEPGPYVTLYEHPDFNNNKRGLTMDINQFGIVGKDEMRKANMEDKPSSMRISKNIRVVTFDKPLHEKKITAHEYYGGENGTQIQRLANNDTMSSISVQYETSDDGVLLSLYNQIYNTGSEAHTYDYGAFVLTQLFSNAGVSPFAVRSIKVSSSAIVTLLQSGQDKGQVFVGFNNPHRVHELNDLENIGMVHIENHVKGVDRLTTNDNITCGFGQSEELISGNREYVLRYENNGNLSLWNRVSGRSAIWQTRKHHKPGKVVLNLKGELTVYDYRNSLVYKSENFVTGKAPYRLIVQDDANVVIYDSENAVVWATHTNRK